MKEIELWELKKNFDENDFTIPNNYFEAIFKLAGPTFKPEELKSVLFDLESEGY